MSYYLMTGGTGLLGHYLLRDAMRQGIRLAVIARGNRLATARARIEDSIARWESVSGRSLPRPVVFEGDLTRPGFGLTAEQRNWIRANCRGAIHNAASLTFVADSPDGEPYRSNVEGTRRLVELCAETGIRELHHVSTAYVCGLREGVILETEVDVGQPLGNDYERSKLEAEKLLRGEKAFDSLTVYRPGIIIGDSRTGYTSTFHGFYVPLKVATGLLSSVPLTEPVELGALLELFGLKGTDTKNFVPVDWVSEALMHIVARREFHGQTYHLTPTAPTPLRSMAEVMDRTLQAHMRIRQDDAGTSLDGLHDVLSSQMSVYQAYWRDDPTFDRTNTVAACQSLPCPNVTEAMLERTCKYAITAGFGWPMPAMRKAQLDVESVLRRNITDEAAPAHDRWELQFEVTGEGGGRFGVQFADARPTALQPGPNSTATDEVYLNAHTLGSLLNGAASLEDAIRQGSLLFTSDRARRCLPQLLAIRA
jgi:thioester reductase-like protein